VSRCCYWGSLLDYEILKEEVSEEVRKVKPKIRRFARCKTALMKIIYEARTIRITLRQGEYLYISWRSTLLWHRVRGWTMDEAIVKMTGLLFVQEL
jgi:hypothetical protein